MLFKEITKTIMKYGIDRDTAENIAQDILMNWEGGSPLPTELEFHKDYFDFEYEDELEDVMLNWLSDEYGYCIYSLNFHIRNDIIYITDIKWDLSE